MYIGFARIDKGIKPGSFCREDFTQNFSKAQHFSTLALVQPSRGLPQDLYGVHSSSATPDTDGITSHCNAVVDDMLAMYKAFQ